MDSKLRQAGDCFIGVMLIVLAFGLGYGAMGMIFQRAASASLLLPQ